MDYMPFGFLSRSYSPTAYRYGFNGKETDSETSTQDYGMRIYNPALGKFLSIDPLSFDYPWNSTYAFAENDVIRCIDLDGLEKVALSGSVPREQYYAIDPSTRDRVDGTTHYDAGHVKTFYKQAERLNKLYGFEAHQVQTGKQLISALQATTKAHGEITHLAFFGHGNPTGLLLSNDEGFYSGDLGSTAKTGDANMDMLQGAIKDGSIKFAKNAKIFIDACNVGLGADIDVNTLGRQITLATGATVVACTGHVEMKTPSHKSVDGNFISPDGVFYEIKRVEKQRKVSVNNPDKSSALEFWKPDKVSKMQKYYDIEIKELGNEVKVDNYVK